MSVILKQSLVVAAKRRRTLPVYHYGPIAKKTVSTGRTLQESVYASSVLGAMIAVTAVLTQRGIDKSKQMFSDDKEDAPPKQVSVEQDKGLNEKLRRMRTGQIPSHVKKSDRLYRLRVDTIFT